MIPGHVIVREVENRTYAHPILDFLRDQGIPAIVHSDDCGGVDPALAFLHRAQILVPTTEGANAERLLALYEAAPLEEGWEDIAAGEHP